MGRLLLLGVLVIAAGAAAYLLMGGHAGDGDSGECSVAPEGSPTVDEAGRPLLVGAGKEATSAETKPVGGFVLRGRVLGEKDARMAGVRVAIRKTWGASWDPKDPRTWGNRTEESLRKSFAALDSPGAPKSAPDREVVSGKEGEFEAPLDVAGTYEAVALVEPPLVSSTASASITSAWTSGALVVRVVTGTPLSGRVVDASDRPVSAVVVASAVMPDTGSAASLLPVPTAEDGTFTFAALPKGSARLSVVVPGRLRFKGPSVTMPTSEPVTIRLPGGTGTVRGKVADLSGKPVADADLVVQVSAAGARRDDGSAALRGRSGPDGTFRLEGSPAGKVTSVQVLAPGFLAHSASVPLAKWSGVEVAQGKDAVLDIVLESGGTVEGRVLEEGTRRPLPGVQVMALTAARTSYSAPVVVTSDTDGAYRLVGVATGRALLLARSPEHYLKVVETSPTFNSWSPDGRSMAAGPPPELVVVVPPEGVVVHRDLVLTRGMEVAGKVVDASGAPVADAEVLSRNNGEQQALQQWGMYYGGIDTLAKSDPEGRFVAKGMPPREQWTLYAKKAPLVGKPCEPFSLTAGGVAPELTLTMATGSTLAGRVVDTEGKGVPDVMIQVWGSGGYGGVANVKPGHSDGSGAFRFEGVGTGNQTLSLSIAGWPQKQHVVEGVKPGEVREGIEVKLEAGVRLAGVVVDAEGKPAAGRQLSFQKENGGQNAWAVTAEDGTFTVSAAPAGRLRAYLQSAESWGGSTSPLGPPFEGPVSDLRFTVPPPAPEAVIEGTVLDTKGGLVPLATVDVDVGSRGDNRGYYPGQDPNEVTNGRFRRTVSGNPPFEVRVRAPRDAQGRPLNLLPKTVKVTDPAAPLEVRLDGGAEVAGRVLDPKGQGVGNLYVRVGAVVGRSAEDGSFRVGGLSDDMVEVVVTATPGYVAPLPTKVRAGTEDVVVRLRQGAVVTGLVLDPDGNPVENGYVNASWAATRESAQGNANAQVVGGRFRLQGVPDDVTVNLLVQSWNVGGETSYPPIEAKDVRPGSGELSLRFETGAVIEGVVLDADGKPATASWVTAQLDPGSATSGRGTSATPQPGGMMNPGASAVPKADGTFRLTGLRRAAYQITAQAQSGSVRSTPVVMSAPAVGVRLTMPRVERITGRLTGSGDLGGFRVYLRAEPLTGNSAYAGNAETKSDGAFVFENVGGGPFTLQASKSEDDRYALVEHVAAGAKDVSADLQMGQSIEGTLDKADGSPIGQGYVSIQQGSIWRSFSRISPDGRWKIRGLPPGRYRVQGQADKQVSELSEELDAGTSGVRLRIK